MSDIATKRFELIELVIPITGANSQTFFTNQPQLQSVDGKQTVYIVAVQLYSDQALAVDPLTAANPVAGVADIINATITFVVSGTESIKRLPLANLNRILPDQTNYVPGQWDLFTFNDICTIDWSKSYVTNAAAVTTQFAFLFGVHYLYAAYAPDGQIVLT